MGEVLSVQDGVSFAECVEGFWGEDDDGAAVVVAPEARKVL
jgi:hypothetical protein